MLPLPATRCAASRSFTPAGSIVTRSFCPLPRRTTTWLRSKSRSLTRSARHSSSRTPVPYSMEQADFFSTEHDRQLVRHACPRHMLDRPDVGAEDLSIEEQHRAQRLVLRRRADLFVDCQPQRTQQAPSRPWSTGPSPDERESTAESSRRTPFCRLLNINDEELRRQ